MKYFCHITILTLLAATALTSCKSEKKAEEDIIVERIVEKPQSKKAERMEGDERNGSTKWIGGAEYTFNIIRQPNDSLPKVENHGRTYHDNSIRLTVHRSDGTVFFQKTFTKDNFAPVLPSQFKEHGVLLGMNFEKAEGNNLRFIVSVGSPDDSNEEFTYAVMNLNNYGATSAEKWQGMETAETE
ncbi:MAG: DUF4738 domain-containing protein [Prevotellaceae bacterium]|nr:DUF4738 domain-containing protein [Prevotellaceae bacterium]